PASRFHPEDRAERAAADISLRPPRDAGLAPAEPPPPAAQQQAGAPGAAPHDGPGDVSAPGHRAEEVLPDLLFRVRLRRPLRHDHWLRGDRETRPRPGTAA